MLQIASFYIWLREFAFPICFSWLSFVVTSRWRRHGLQLWKEPNLSFSRSLTRRKWWGISIPMDPRINEIPSSMLFLGYFFIVLRRHRYYSLPGVPFPSHNVVRGNKQFQVGNLNTVLCHCAPIVFPGHSSVPNWFKARNNWHSNIIFWHFTLPSTLQAMPPQQADANWQKVLIILLALPVAGLTVTPIGSPVSAQIILTFTFTSHWDKDKRLLRRPYVRNSGMYSIVSRSEVF